MKRITALFLVALLLLTGCAASEGKGEQTVPSTSVQPQQTDPAPSEQTVPEQTKPEQTEPGQTDPVSAEPAFVIPDEGEPLSAADIQRYQQLFSQQRDAYAVQPINWYNRILLVSFDSPENVDLSVLFAGGTKAVNGKLSEEEKTYLTAMGMNTDLDVSRIPTAEAEEVLTAYFGLTWDETEGIGTDKMICSQDGDCWYRSMSGAVTAENFTILGGAVLPGGSIRLYYRFENGDSLWAITLYSRMTEGETGYRVLSNVPVV